MTKFAYLGPEGTYSDEAVHLFAQEAAGEDAAQTPEYLACATIMEVFAKVSVGDADFGVVPIENSLEGSVNTTLDELAFGPAVRILGEKTLDIHHALVAAPGTRLEDITTVLSHLQAIGQCSHWINDKLPGRPVLAANSTADAVRLAVPRPGYAAVASEFAAGLYGAEVLERSIEDEPNNQTSFVLIANPQVAAGYRSAEPAAGQQYKTTVALFQVDDKPGSLLMILSEFAKASVNLTKIQSRPTKQAMGEYMFFLDFEGQQSDPAVKAALDSLRGVLREVKVLGSYPAA